MASISHVFTRDTGAEFDVLLPNGKTAKYKLWVAFSFLFIQHVVTHSILQQRRHSSTSVIPSTLVVSSKRMTDKINREQGRVQSEDESHSSVSTKATMCVTNMLHLYKAYPVVQNGERGARHPYAHGVFPHFCGGWQHSVRCLWPTKNFLSSTDFFQEASDSCCSWWRVRGPVRGRGCKSQTSTTHVSSLWPRLALY